MRMQLKNNEKKFKINLKELFTIKNLKMFLISFIIVSIIIGIVFYLLLNTVNKEQITNNIKEYFIIDDSYDYLNILKNTVLNNTFNIFLIWIFGISIIGIVVIIGILFIELFGVGITLASMFNSYGIKGIIAFLCYVFPAKTMYLLILFISCYASILFSYKLIRIIFFKDDIKINILSKKYIKILIVLILSIICYSILEVFISPLMIKLFSILS